MQAFTLWLPIAIVATALTLLVYVGLQQNYRQSANDPQIQWAEDTAAALNTGSTPQSQVSSQVVNIATSLAPFTIITDENGKILASSATLAGKTPVPPQGVLDNAKSSENRLTWEPQPNLRFATVVVHYSGKTSGYVISGRSLREVENRVNDLGTMTLWDYAAFMVVSFIAVLFALPQGKNK